MLFFAPNTIPLENAACIDLPEAQKQMFFSPAWQDQHRAKAICRACPITARCLEQALAFELEHPCHGVWGEKSAMERKKLVRGRR